MIHVFIRGRLGNQLFQYAFVRQLQILNPGIEVVYHFDEVYSNGNLDNGWENSLRWFNTVDVKEGKFPVSISFFQKLFLRLYFWRYPHDGSLIQKNKFQRKWVRLLSHFGLFYLDLGFYSFPQKVSSETIISGNFESEKYFENIRNLLLTEIKPVNPVLPKNRSLLRHILSSNSVCVSIRRGDFVENRDLEKVHNVCTLSYYEKGMKKIISMVSNPVFFFFSDDIDWVKKTIKVDFPCYYESGDDPVWEKLRLMYSCKHFIISNSSFSWWAQYLSVEKDKIVIAPSRWYKVPFESDLYQPKWTVIDV